MAYRRLRAKRLHLFNEHTWLVHKLCSLWGWWRAKLAKCEREDLLQHGYLALWKATSTWKARSGIKFATYASYKIRWALQDCVDLARFGKQNRLKLQGGLSLFDHSQLKEYKEHDAAQER